MAGHERAGVPCLHRRVRHVYCTSRVCTLEENAQELLHRLDDLTAEIAAEVASARGEPFIVFHDSYRYAETGVSIARASLACAGLPASLPPAAHEASKATLVTSPDRGLVGLARLVLDIQRRTNAKVASHSTPIPGWSPAIVSRRAF